MKRKKSALASKTIHFNWLNGLIIPAVWPLLPASFRNQDYAIAAITAWISIGNIVLRLITKDKIEGIVEDSKSKKRRKKFDRMLDSDKYD